MRHHQRAVEWRIGQFAPPQIECAQAEPAYERFGFLALAIGREHAAGPVAGREHHRFVAALIERDVVPGLREQQGLPRAGNASADDGNGGLPPSRLDVLIHPCPFAGMTRIRFKGSPRSSGGTALSLRYLSSSSELPSEQNVM